MAKIDGVVKSPIYYVLVPDLTFDVPYVLLQGWPNTKYCTWNGFLSHLNTFLRDHQYYEKNNTTNLYEM